jgi:hypothetical protein
MRGFFRINRLSMSEWVKQGFMGEIVMPSVTAVTLYFRFNRA